MLFKDPAAIMYRGAWINIGLLQVGYTLISHYFMNLQRCHNLPSLHFVRPTMASHCFDQNPPQQNYPGSLAPSCEEIVDAPKR